MRRVLDGVAMPAPHWLLATQVDSEAEDDPEKPGTPGSEGSRPGSRPSSKRSTRSDDDNDASAPA